MADLDLLTQPSDMVIASAVLTDCGYRLRQTSERHLVFTPAADKPNKTIHLGEHADIPLKIELHCCISEQLPVRTVNITSEIQSRIQAPGLHPYPSISALMLHLLLHAAANMRANALRHIQLHDIAKIAIRMKDADWHELLAKRPGGMPVWWTHPPLVLAARYYKGHVPAFVLESLVRSSSPRLRRLALQADLTSVSWSNIRIEAFPGLGWACSTGEALRFMARRVWPSPAALRQLRESAAHMSLQSAAPWYGLSHPSRILRWLFSNAPRVQTLICVQLALDAEAVGFSPLA